MTSNCRTPTAPRTGSRSMRSGSWKTWTAPSSESWSSPFLSCFLLAGSSMTTRLKNSGEKRGMPSNSIPGPSASESPMRRLPASQSPRMSPAHASSMSVRSCARNWSGFASFSVRPVRGFRTSMPRVNLPETMRTNAMRSRCAGSMFAWILKTKPENAGESGSTSPVAVLRGSGAGASSRKRFRNGSTPKSLIALPKKTGVIAPARNASRSKAWPRLEELELAHERRRETRRRCF